MEAISEYQRKQKDILAPIVYAYEWNDKLAKEWLDKRRKVTLKLYKDLYNAAKKEALKKDKSYYAKKKKIPVIKCKTKTDNSDLIEGHKTFLANGAREATSPEHVIELISELVAHASALSHEAKLLPLDPYAPRNCTMVWSPMPLQSISACGY